MTQHDNISKYEKLLTDMAIDGRWEELDRTRQAFGQLMISAVQKRDAALLKRIEATLIEAHRIVVIKYSAVREAQAHASGLLAEARMAALAYLKTPKRSATFARDAISVINAVVIALYRAPARKLSNRELIEITNAADATVTRALGDLREREFATWWRAGRTVINQLTDAGIAYARSLTPDVVPNAPALGASAAVESAVVHTLRGAGGAVSDRMAQRTKELERPDEHLRDEEEQRIAAFKT